jgi:hypothetical protein
MIRKKTKFGLYKDFFYPFLNMNLKYLEFYFDKNGKVTYVIASGYPDSIRYELRKK